MSQAVEELKRAKDGPEIAALKEGLRRSSQPIGRY